MKRKIAATYSTSKLYRSAERIADDMAEFLDATTRIADITDYLDTADMKVLGDAMDILYDFALMYSNVEASASTADAATFSQRSARRIASPQTTDGIC